MLDQVLVQATAPFPVPLRAHCEKEPWATIARNYPAFFSLQGDLIFVDEWGPIVGFYQGVRRATEPKAIPDRHEVTAARAWLDFVELERTSTPTIRSRELACEASEFLGRPISNGAMILALAKLDFYQSVPRTTSNNCETIACISKKSWRKFLERCEVAR